MKNKTTTTLTLVMLLLLTTAHAQQNPTDLNINAPPFIRDGEEIQITLIPTNNQPITITNIDIQDNNGKTILSITPPQTTYTQQNTKGKQKQKTQTQQITIQTDKLTTGLKNTDQINLTLIIYYTLNGKPLKTAQTITLTYLKNKIPIPIQPTASRVQTNLKLKTKGK
jgi:hypothetical protein